MKTQSIMLFVKNNKEQLGQHGVFETSMGKSRNNQNHFRDLVAKKTNLTKEEDLFLPLPFH